LHDVATQRVALKIDVDTLRGTLEGVPALIDLIGRCGCGASFFFSLGPDNTGRALRRAFRRGFLSKVRRTSVVAHYGWRTLTRGLLWPGPRIGRHAGHVMRRARAQGFEVGVHCYDHVRWQDQVAQRDGQWAARELELACQAFRDVFDAAPEAHAAAGWQLNPPTLLLESALAFRYASDTRGREPFLPSWTGTEGYCPQLPTTLPTLDELIGRDGLSPEGAAGEILQLSRSPLARGHVFTLHAELEGMGLINTFEFMLRSWRDAGVELVALRSVYAALDVRALPRHEISMQPLPGRSGTLATQGDRIGPSPPSTSKIAPSPRVARP
jgi:peptidoglycan/xylan/chitin deacetylase (PgdA/CDA1 family)